jgi:hypothetical protein
LLGFHFFIIIIMNSQDLGPIRPVPLGTEDAVGLTIFVLFCPNHGVSLDNTGDPGVRDDLISFLPHISSISFGTEQRLHL